MKVAFSPAAQADLMDIALYIAQDNPKRALKFVDDLEGQCDALGAAPGIGTSRPDLGQGIRMFPHGRYLIFYCESNKGLRIERILHGSRDIDHDDIEASNPGGESATRPITYRLASATKVHANRAGHRPRNLAGGHDASAGAACFTELASMT